MKKAFKILGIGILVVILSGNAIIKNNFKQISAEIFYVDHTMLRLIPIDINLGYTTVNLGAKKMLDKLIEGQDDNRKILRVIPNKKNCMCVDVKDRTAYVNLKHALLDNLSDNRNHELLFLYQIVNSLTSIEGIDTVKFLINGEDKKEFMAGIDMREYFIPDYYI